MKFKKRLKQLDSILSLDTVPEVSINYQPTPIKKRKVKNSKEMAKFVRRLFDKKSFELKESFVVVILDNEHKPFGYFVHATGRMESVNVDDRLIFQKLLLVGGARFIVAHNHPLSKSDPSDEDVKATYALKHKAEFLELELVDHIILSKKGYYSFSDYGLI